MSRFTAVFSEVSTGERSSGEHAGASIAKCARALSRALSQAWVEACGLFRSAAEFRRTLYDLENLDDAALRELGIRRSDFRDIAWSEARRSRQQKKALNVTAPLQR